MSTTEIPWSQQHTWSPQPGAETLIQRWTRGFLDALPQAAHLAARMEAETGTRFGDWIDTVVLGRDQAGHDQTGNARALAEAGFVEEPGPASLPRVWRHPGGLFPTVAQTVHDAAPTQIWIRCDAVDDFRVRHAGCDTVEGEPGARLRRVLFARTSDAELWAVERRGYTGLAPTDAELAQDRARAGAAAEVLAGFRRRPRHADAGTDAQIDAQIFDQAFGQTQKLIEDAVARVGADLACHLFFVAEREYWQQRNRAARIQKARQDALGLGWGNHDHHTYRSSRQSFAHLVRALETLGFHLRERFYAGREAGWGAQVLEQPGAGVAVFADVDLSPDELLGDFAHEPLAERDTLGTVGLWCALHGEAFLQAGMHHLATWAHFDSLRAQLRDHDGIASMKPFTDFPHLRQCFTEGETWPVAEARIDALRHSGRIDAAQAERFRRHGTIGSHLEIVERNAGFKGFNQTGISEIITATDPRRQQPA